MKSKIKLCLVLIIFCSWGQLVSALDVDGAREQSCLPLPAVYVDRDWVKLVENQHFYYPIMSRYHLYKVIAQMSPGIPPSTILEGSVYYDSCIRMQLYPGGALLTGYGGSRFTRQINEPSPNGDGGFLFRPSDGPGVNGTYYVSLTDNKSFILTSYCDAEDQAFWGVFSTTPTLPEKTREVIERYVVGLGFKREYFTELRYDTCKRYSSPEVFKNRQSYGWTA